MFLSKFRSLLKNHTQWLCAIVISFTVVIAWRWIYYLHKDHFLRVHPYSDFTENLKPIFANTILFSAFIVEILIGVLIGLLAWRMVVIAVYTRRLSNEFHLQPQMWHPDEAGGLKPLGNLCLLSATILTIPGLFLSSWIILAPTLFADRYGDQYTTLYFILLLVTIFLAVIALFLPLQGVHRVLIAKREEIKLKIEQLGHHIDVLTGQILEITVTMNTTDATDEERITKKLAFMRQVYKEQKKLPVWPFDFRIFFLGQVLPVLGWLTGLIQTFTKLLSSLSS